MAALLRPVGQRHRHRLQSTSISSLTLLDTPFVSRGPLFWPVPQPAGHRRHVLFLCRHQLNKHKSSPDTGARPTLRQCSRLPCTGASLGNVEDTEIIGRPDLKLLCSHAKVCRAEPQVQCHSLPHSAFVLHSTAPVTWRRCWRPVEVVLPWARLSLWAGDGRWSCRRGVRGSQGGLSPPQLRQGQHFAETLLLALHPHPGQVIAEQGLQMD